MYSSGVKDVIESMNKITKKEDGDPFLHGYRTFPFSTGGFAELNPNDSKLVFIDGGNAEIVHTPTFSVFIVRLYYNIFQHGMKTGAKRHEFYALSWADENLFYRAKLFPVTNGCVMPSENDLSLSITDPTIKDGIFAADIAKMGNIIRKFAEWKLASCIDEKGCIIVKDGTLQAGITNESTCAESAFNVAIKNGNVVASVAKTSTIFTTTGNNFLSVLQKNSPFGAWKYHIGDNNTTSVYAAKFHKSSRHAFRIDCMKGKDVSDSIAPNCSDYRFPGYPYGLVDADTFGKIPDSEKAYHKTLFLSAMKDHSHHISSGDAHDILNDLIK